MSITKHFEAILWANKELPESKAMLPICHNQIRIIDRQAADDFVSFKYSLDITPRTL